MPLFLYCVVTGIDGKMLYYSMQIASHIALLLLGGTGFAISLYFTLVYYNRLEPNAAFLPQFCSMEKGTCTTVLQYQEARLLRFAPNFVLGLGFYLLIMVFGVLQLAGVDVDEIVVGFIRIASGFTVAISLHLAWALLFKLKVPCKLCFTSHAVNIAILLILLLL